MVILSIDEFKQITQNIDIKLFEAERLAQNTNNRLSVETVFDNTR